MKFMWEDVTNQQIVYGTSSGIETNRKSHFNKLNVNSLHSIPQPLTKAQFDKGTNTNNMNNKINIEKYNPYNLKLNRNILKIRTTNNLPSTTNVVKQIKQINQIKK